MMERQKRVLHNRSVLMIAVSMSALALVCACSSVMPTRSAHASVTSDGAQSILSIELPKEQIAEGSVFNVSVFAKQELRELTGLFQTHLVDFYPEPSEEQGMYKYSALVGVEYDTVPGAVKFAVKARLDDQQFLEESANIEVKKGVFPSERLSVPPRTVKPRASDMKKIARDRAILAKVYASRTKTKYWDPPSVAPVNSVITSVYGSARVYNGKKQSVHLGTDLRAPTGTPIAAPITGRIAVARHLFFTGYTVVLDHGFGLFTIYGHMSKLKVKEGDVIKKGEIMGFAGATGRASGPHLHWGVNLHGAKVDPTLLVQALK